MLGPFATTSRLTPIHQVSPLYCRTPPVHRCPQRRRQRQRVHDRGDRCGPLEWAQSLIFSLKCACRPFLRQIISFDVRRAVFNDLLKEVSFVGFECLRLKLGTPPRVGQTLPRLGNVNRTRRRRCARYQHQHQQHCQRRFPLQFFHVSCRQTP